jgi:anaerobic dimethyl sulfoxide reductase subunit A
VSGAGSNAKATETRRTACPAHNCGGRCLLKAHVAEGRIVRLETDDRPEDPVARPQLRACTRGRAYLRRQYHPDRLTEPLERVGPRGEGRFRPVSWEHALDRFAEQLRRVRGEYGNGALHVPYGTGGYSQMTGSQTARRMLNLFGGQLGIYNSYSWGATNIVTPLTVGTVKCGSERQDWLNSKLILMWGWNPAEGRDGTNSDYFVHLARRAGARVICIDPRHTPSAASLADEWVPLRPGTDAALMTAMAYVILSEGLHDEGFVRRCCSGFDAAQMPAATQGAESYSDYVLGQRDGIPKTPEWAEAITAVPRDVIARLAREYATTRPAMLYQGYAMQRRDYGEQVVRAGMALAAITGNLGRSGGWASGLSSQPTPGPYWSVFPEEENPHGLAIPCFLWAEAIRRGREMGVAEGVRGLQARGLQRLDSDIKLVWSVASNVLANQHGDLNRTAELLRDESKLEYLVVQDNFLTPTARFADLVLPACTQFETWGVADGWKYGQEVLLMPKLVEPLGQSKSDYRIAAQLAERLGIADAYTQGRDERDWTEWALDQYREHWLPELPSLDEMLERDLGAFSLTITDPVIGLAEFAESPEEHPLDTPSGRIELFSSVLHEHGEPERVPAVPKYIQEEESPFGPEAASYPLQCIAHHTMARVHSTHDNNDWLREAHPQRLWIHPFDAEPRGLTDGELVRVYNGRGATVVPCLVTQRILPGVVNLPQGTWWTPDADGVDQRGSVNVLTSERWTPYAHGAALQTVMVQVRKESSQGSAS